MKRMSHRKHEDGEPLGVSHVVDTLHRFPAFVAIRLAQNLVASVTLSLVSLMSFSEKKSRL